jgi:hypothetical protein
MPCFPRFLYTNAWAVVYFEVSFSVCGGYLALQHCTVCGSEIPDDARFCGKCGHTFSTVSTIDEETPVSDTAAVNGRHMEDVAALSTQELERPEESKNGKHTEDVAALSTQELVQAEEVEEAKTSDTVVENGQEAEDVAELSTQELVQAEEAEEAKTSDTVVENGEQAEDVAELSTQELVHAEDKEQVEGSTPDVPEVSDEAAVPQGFTEADRVHTQVSVLQTSEQVEEEQVPRQYPVSPAPKIRRGTSSRWIMIAAVCLLVLASVAGGLLFLLRSQGTVTTTTPAVGISPTSSNVGGITPVVTVCPTSSTASSCITPTTGSTPEVGSNAVFNITFSGAVQGTMAVTSIARCGVTTSGTEYDLYFIGMVGNTQYNFVSRIPAYNGPATYKTGQISVVFAQQPLTATTIWGNSGNASATATINGDVKSGTLDITLAGKANAVNVVGNWVCG